MDSTLSGELGGEGDLPLLSRPLDGEQVSGVRGAFEEERDSSCPATAWNNSPEIQLGFVAPFLIPWSS